MQDLTYYKYYLKIIFFIFKNKIHLFKDVLKSQRKDNNQNINKNIFYFKKRHIEKISIKIKTKIKIKKKKKQ